MSLARTFTPIRKRLHWTWLPIIGDFQEPAHEWGNFHSIRQVEKKRRPLFFRSLRRRLKRAGQLELFH